MFYSRFSFLNLLFDQLMGDPSHRPNNIFVKKLHIQELGYVHVKSVESVGRKTLRH